jgi:S-adenosylmethionine:tRNA ribosyltransferase-isomerase
VSAAAVLWQWTKATEAPAAREPPEARGLARDGVRLMVSRGRGELITHAQFRHLPDYLRPGDVVVVNTSATINASLDAAREGGRGQPAEPIELHLSTPLPGGTDRQWVIEVRRLSTEGTVPLLTARAGERLRLEGGGTATLVGPYLPDGRVTESPREHSRPEDRVTASLFALSRPEDRIAASLLAVSRRTGASIHPGVRLWVADLDVPGGVLGYAAAHGSPIRYGYVRDAWPLEYYQTVFASEPGSAEMPSAGRAFTPALIARLEGLGVQVARLVLHTGVASLEAGETPYPERYRVPTETAEAVNRARRSGGRVVAVGTTVVRALETVASTVGGVHPGEGWTDLVITPEHGIRTVDLLLTGLHEPRSSHLAMLEALAGREHVARAYEAAVEGGYLWHEFGDMHLIQRDP